MLVMEKYQRKRDLCSHQNPQQENDNARKYKERKRRKKYRMKSANKSLDHMSIVQWRLLSSNFHETTANHLSNVIYFYLLLLQKLKRNYPVESKKKIIPYWQHRYI